jgi:hypothetical protein
VPVWLGAEERVCCDDEEEKTCGEQQQDGACEAAESVLLEALSEESCEGNDLGGNIPKNR